MSSKELADKIGHWTQTYNFCGEVSSSRTDTHHVIQFEARTTKTRASSMVTRVKLMANEVIVGYDFSVSKELLSDPPRDRAALATWRISVKIAIKNKRKRVA
jgi:FAD synthase